MRSSGQFQAFLFFFTKIFCKRKKHKTHISEQKQGSVIMRIGGGGGGGGGGGESLIRLFVLFMCFLCLVAFLYFFCFLCVQNLFVKK